MTDLHIHTCAHVSLEVKETELVACWLSRLSKLSTITIVCDKLKSYNLNPYIINWILSFLRDQKQRVVIDRGTTKFVDINRGVPQVLAPVLFSVMVNDITAANPSCNLLVKYTDNITIGAPVGSSVVDQLQTEVNNIPCWATENWMTLILKKTWEMILRGKTKKPLPVPLLDMKRKNALNY